MNPPTRSLDDILAPFRKEFAESGMTEEELDALIEEAREEVWQEQQSAKPSIVTEPQPGASQ